MSSPCCLTRAHIVAAVVALSTVVFSLAWLAPATSGAEASHVMQDRETSTPDLVVATPTSAAPIATTTSASRVGVIVLTTAGAPKTAWAVVQWLAGGDRWVAVNGWQNYLDASGRSAWSVTDPQLGASGTFRWVVYDRPGGVLWAISPTFALPAAANQQVSVSATPVVNVTPAPTATSGATNSAGSRPSGPLKTRETHPIAPGIYVVQEGDTLYRIALRAGLTISTLQAANGLTSSFLLLGQPLSIPVSAGAPAGVTPAAPTRAPSGQVRTYIVRTGDTLFRIALNQGIPLAALMQANGLTDTLIHPGQTLVIPSP